MGSNSNVSFDFFHFFKNLFSLCVSLSPPTAVAQKCTRIGHVIFLVCVIKQKKASSGGPSPP